MLRLTILTLVGVLVFVALGFAGLVATPWLLDMMHSNYCGALTYVPPLQGLTADEVRAKTGWQLSPAGGADYLYVVDSQSGLGTGGGEILPLSERVGPLVLTFDANGVVYGRVSRVNCANWTGP
jgi:hypothetical protein